MPAQFGLTRDERHTHAHAPYKGCVRVCLPVSQLCDQVDLHGKLQTAFVSLKCSLNQRFFAPGDQHFVAGSFACFAQLEQLFVGDQIG